jgi:hypothetical protein
LNNKLKSVQTNFFYKKLCIIKGISRKKWSSGMKKRNINKRQFVLCMDEYPQTLQGLIIGDDDE